MDLAPQNRFLPSGLAPLSIQAAMTQQNRFLPVASRP